MTWSQELASDLAVLGVDASSLPCTLISDGEFIHTEQLSRQHRMFKPVAEPKNLAELLALDAARCIHCSPQVAGVSLALLSEIAHHSASLVTSARLLESGEDLALAAESWCEDAASMSYLASSGDAFTAEVFAPMRSAVSDALVAPLRVSLEAVRAVAAFMILREADVSPSTRRFLVSKLLERRDPELIVLNAFSPPRWLSELGGSWLGERWAQWFSSYDRAPFFESLDASYASHDDDTYDEGFDVFVWSLVRHRFGDFRVLLTDSLIGELFMRLRSHVLEVTDEDTPESVEILDCLVKDKRLVTTSDLEQLLEISRRL